MKSYIKRIFSAALCVMMLATMVLPNIPAAKADEPESTQKTLYVFDLEAFINTLPKAGEARYDYLKIATALQGLVNRDEAQLYYLFETNSFAKNNGNVDMDEYWLEKLSEEDEYLASFTQRKDVADFYELFTIFEDYYDGIVLWDPDVPATSNVASTVAGADDLLPVRYLTGEGSLWAALQEKNLFAEGDVKVNLVDKFADNATNIPDSTTASTGSAKNDAYIWAKEQYLDTGKTSADLMTYTVDAWVKTSSETVPDDAEFISAKLPKVMKAGSTVEIEVTVKNVGTNAWSESSLYRLGSPADAASSFYWTNTVGDVNVHDRMFIEASETVDGGTTYTFKGKITAPNTSGDYAFDLKMVHDGVAWFGDTLSRTIKVVGGTTTEGPAKVSSIDLTKEGVVEENHDERFTSLDAGFVEVKLPTTMEVGSSTTVYVTVKNRSTDTWSESDNMMRLGRKDGYTDFKFVDKNYTTAEYNRAVLPSGVEVKAGETYTYSFTIQAPNTTGKKTLKMQMICDGLAWIGDILTWEINVVDTSVKTVDTTATGVLTDGATTEELNAQIVEVKLPETMVAGSTAKVSVTVKNLGTQVWCERDNTSDPGERLGRVDNFTDFNWPGFVNGNRAQITGSEQVSKDGTYTFTFNIVAPNTTGEKIFKAQMIRDGVAWFGPILTYTINVIEAFNTTIISTGDDSSYTDADFEPTLEIIDDNAQVMYSDLMNTMLPNADYYIAKKAFFWDLSPDDSIAPIDDRNQKVGTDVQTLNAILASQQKRAEDAVKAGDKTDAVFTVSGFVPWWLKYTTTSDPGHSTMGDVPSEWKMVEIISSYLGQVDADAYGMTSVSNTSVFSKIPLDTREQSGKYDAENVNTDVVYDKDTNYILFYMGDYDASSWTSGCLPLLWDDTERGTRSDVPLAWAVCSDLAQCVPHVFNYLYETASENDYFVAGDNGTGYLDPMKLTDEQLTVWKDHNKTANEKFDIDVQGFLIAGNSGTITEKVQEAYNEMTPVGVVYQGGVNKDIYEGVPYVAYYDIGNQIKSSSAASVANTIKSNMAATGQFHVYRSILTSPSAIYDIVDELNKTDAKFEVLDPYTFFKFYADSDGGTKSVAPITYEAPKASEITVDGEIKDAEWADAKEIKISVASDDVKKYGTNWNVSSDDTVSANFKLKWDSQYLYIAQTITDEALLPMTDTSKMNYLSNDATMLFLDMNGSRVGSTYLAGDYAVYYAFDSDYEPVVFLRSAPSGATTEVKLSSSQYQAKFTFNADKTSATMELALPWSLFQDVTFTPEEGKSVGMTVMIIDHDVTTDNGGRQIMWCGAGDEQSGWAGMKLVAGTVTVDKTALKAAIEAAEAIDLSKYQNGAEKDAFEEALAAAKTVYAKEDATQTEVDNATTALTKAQDGLKPKNSSGSIPTVKPTVSNNTKHPFTDVSSSDWYNDDVQYVYEKGLMSGISGKEFAPNATVTRAMVATILWRMEGEPAASYGTDFTDVEKNQWYSEAIAWTAHNGIFGGYGNGLFGTNDPITREQLATILYRYAQYQGRSMSVSGKLSAFADGAQVSAYAMDAMQWCVGSGLLNGADGKLNPTGTATRAELAAILHRFTK